MTKRMRVLAMIVIAVMAVGASGCSASDPDSGLKKSLASMTESAQDHVWPFRHDLIRDTEAAVPELYAVADLRPLLDDATLPTPSGSFGLVEAVQSDGAATLLMVVEGSSTSGGGWTYSQRTAYTCFTLTMELHMPMVAAPAPCTTSDGRDVTVLFEDDPTVIPFEDLNVRLSVDSSTYKKSCQCTSGSPCECPGG